MSLGLTKYDKDFFNTINNLKTDDPIIGNFINTCQDCGIKIDISREANLYNKDYYDGIGENIRVNLNGNKNSFSRLNTCVDGTAPDKTSILKEEISNLKDQIKEYKEKIDLSSILFARIKSKFIEEADEDIFYSEIWEKALEIVNNEIRSMEIL